MKALPVWLAAAVLTAACSTAATPSTSPATSQDQSAGDTSASDASAGDTSASDASASDLGASDAGAADTSPTPAGLILLAKAATEDVEVELLAAKPLAVGWQQVYYRVTAAGKAVGEATVVQRPLMQMMKMGHACPVVQPAATADASGLFAGELLFQMASNASESWILDVDVTPSGGTKRTVALGKLSVAASPWAKTLIVGSGMMAERYTVVLHFPSSPKIGLNDYRVALHRASSDLMSFEPVADATLKSTTEMPSMGHGSPNNVEPVHQAGGFYAGKVNLTMPGDWRLTVAVTVGGKAIGNAVFDWDL